MDWKFLITTAIAILALGISWKARREARQASNATFDLQKRLEQYEHFPIIKVSVMPENDRVRVDVANISSRNSVSSFKVRFILRISAGNNTFSVVKEDYNYLGGLINPNSVERIYPDEINECIAHALPVLSKYPAEQNHFFLRAYVECTPPYNNSENIHVNNAGYFALSNGTLVLTDSPR